MADFRKLLNNAVNKGMASAKEIDELLGDGTSKLLNQGKNFANATAKEVDELLGKGTSKLLKAGGKAANATAKEIDNLLGEGTSKLIKQGLKNPKTVAKSAGKAVGAAKAGAKGAGLVSTLLLANDIRLAMDKGGIAEVQRQLPNLVAQYGGGTVGAAIGAAAGTPLGPVGSALTAFAGGLIGGTVTPKMLGLTDEQAEEIKQGVKQVNPNVKAATPVTNNTTASPTNYGTGNNYVGYDRGATGLIQPESEIQQMIVRIAKEEGVDPAIALAMARQESGFNPKAMSPAGAIGVMQLMPATAKELGVNPYNAEENIRGGLRYFRQQFDRFGGSVNKALAAYNAGAGNVQKYGGIPPFAETQNYVNNIASMIPQYRNELGNVNMSAGRNQGNNSGYNGTSTNIAPQSGTVPANPQIVINTPTVQDAMNIRGQFINSPENMLKEAQLQQSLNDISQQNATYGSQMMNILNNAYNNMMQANEQNPLYQGGLVPSQGYNVDIEQLKRNQLTNNMLADYMFHQGKAAPQDFAARQMANAQQLYEAQMANAAGVPYADYKNAMIQRQAQNIANQQFLAEQALKVQLQFANNDVERAKILGELQKVREQGYNTFTNTILQGQNTLNNTQLEGYNQLQNTQLEGYNQLRNTALGGQYDLTQEGMKQNNPYSNFDKAFGSLGPIFYTNPQAAGGILQSMNPSLLQTIFPNATPEQIQQTFGRMNANSFVPNQAAQTGLFNEAWNKIRGLKSVKE